MQGFCYHRHSCCQCVNRTLVKRVPNRKFFPPRGRGLKYSLRLNLRSGLPSREAALALIFQSPLDGSTSNLNVFVMADGEMVPNTAKSRSVLGAKLRCISDLSNADHFRSSSDSRHFQRQSACLKGAMSGPSARQQTAFLFDGLRRFHNSGDAGQAT
jgi:hypothetical protein